MEVRLASSPTIETCTGETIVFVCTFKQTLAHFWTISNTVIASLIVTSLLPLPSMIGFEFNRTTALDGQLLSN